MPGFLWIIFLLVGGGCISCVLLKKKSIIFRDKNIWAITTHIYAHMWGVFGTPNRVYPYIFYLKNIKVPTWASQTKQFFLLSFAYWGLRIVDILPERLLRKCSNHKITLISLFIFVDDNRNQIWCLRQSWHKNTAVNIYWEDMNICNTILKNIFLYFIWVCVHHASITPRAPPAQVETPWHPQLTQKCQHQELGRRGHLHFISRLAA